MRTGIIVVQDDTRIRYEPAPRPKVQTLQTEMKTSRACSVTTVETDAASVAYSKVPNTTIVDVDRPPATTGHGRCYHLAGAAWAYVASPSGRC
ncbi:hypothetical protein EVAR_20887_1 [Eumeta japonica]|uniref:Uncharacterized protein n=1 Tax=Eumeta variegata TaxID=151549 RepID=A0A4C1UVH1_EUMVA|nr:hypothetical protein EVAR_20887_1 [Eumeta japonica]